MTTHPTPTTLVIGGNGKSGRRVAARLEALGRPVRIGSRSGTPPFDWDDRTTWSTALEGIGAVYVTYAPDLAFPGAADTVGAFFELAVEHGVRRLVLLSGRGEAGAVRAEQALQGSGAAWTIVRSSFFAQNFDEGFFLEPVRDGVVAVPARDVAEPFIDVEDIADVVVAALTDDRHIGELYEVTGPRLLTFADVVTEIAAAAGRDVVYVPISSEDFSVGLLEAGVPVDEATGLVELFAEVLDGRNAYVTGGVQRALGREPRDFAEYARETAATGVWAATEDVAS